MPPDALVLTPSMAPPPDQAASPATSKSGTFVSIQVLRGIAALLVTIFHAGLRFDVSEATFRQGNAGVDIFFVISGFVMWTVTLRRPTSPAMFLRHRFVRLVPMYWIFTFALVAGFLAVPQAFPRMKLTLDHVLLSLAFIPHSSLGGTVPVLAQGWTLNYEVFFYLLFAMCLALPARARLVAISVALIALPMLRPLLPAPGIALEWLLSPLLIEFLAGIAIANLVARGRLPGAVVCGVGIAAAIVLLLFSAPDRDNDFARLIQYGGPATLLVAGAVGLEMRGVVRMGGFPKLLGDASYSIYLSHTFVISILGKLWPASLPDWLFMATATVASVLAGIAVYALLERSLLDLMRGRRPSVRRQLSTP